MEEQYKLTRDDYIKLILASAIFVTAFLVIFMETSHKEELKIGDVTLRTSDYKILNDKFEGYVGYQICNLESGKCARMINIDRANELNKQLSSLD